MTRITRSRLSNVIIALTTLAEDDQVVLSLGPDGSSMVNGAILAGLCIYVACGIPSILMIR